MIGIMGVWGIKQESRVFTLLGLTLPRDGLPSLTMPHEASIPRLALPQPVSPKPAESSHASPELACTRLATPRKLGRLKNLALPDQATTSHALPNQATPYHAAPRR